MCFTRLKPHAIFEALYAQLSDLLWWTTVHCRWNNREVNEMGKDSSSAVWHNFISCFQVSGTVGLKKSRAAYRSGVCWNRGKEQQSGFRNSCMKSQLGREPATKRCQPSEATWHGTLGHWGAAGTGGVRPSCGGTGQVWHGALRTEGKTDGIPKWEGPRPELGKQKALAIIWLNIRTQKQQGM